MKKLCCLCLCVMLCLCLSNAFAAGKLNIVQENYWTVPSYSTYGYVFAKVENSGDKPVKINDGVLEVYDAAGEVIASGDYLSTYARYLQPGEYTYISINDKIDGADEGIVADDYMLTLTGKSDNEYASMRLPCTTDLAMSQEEGWWTYNYMYAFVTNDTDETLYDICVVLALLDADGNILYMDNERMYDSCGLTPGSGLVIRKDISSSFMDLIKANNLNPATVDAIAYVDVKTK